MKKWAARLWTKAQQSVPGRKDRQDADKKLSGNNKTLRNNVIRKVLKKHKALSIYTKHAYRHRTFRTCLKYYGQAEPVFVAAVQLRISCSTLKEI